MSDTDKATDEAPTAIQQCGSCGRRRIDNLPPPVAAQPITEWPRAERRKLLLDYVRSAQEAGGLSVEETARFAEAETILSPHGFAYLATKNGYEIKRLNQRWQDLGTTDLKDGTARTVHTELTAARNLTALLNRASVQAASLDRELVTVMLDMEPSEEKAAKINDWIERRRKLNDIVDIEAEGISVLADLARAIYRANDRWFDEEFGQALCGDCARKHPPVREPVHAGAPLDDEEAARIVGPAPEIKEMPEAKPIGKQVRGPSTKNFPTPASLTALLEWQARMTTSGGYDPTGSSAADATYRAEIAERRAALLQAEVETLRSVMNRLPSLVDEIIAKRLAPPAGGVAEAASDLAGKLDALSSVIEERVSQSPAAADGPR